jgi:hypothetical protein
MRFKFCITGRPIFFQFSTLRRLRRPPGVSVSNVVDLVDGHVLRCQQLQTLTDIPVSHQACQTCCFWTSVCQQCAEIWNCWPIKEPLPSSIGQAISRREPGSLSRGAGSRVLHQEIQGWQQFTGDLTFACSPISDGVNQRRATHRMRSRRAAAGERSYIAFYIKDHQQID